MNQLLIVGGSKGIGAAIVEKELTHRSVINLSRTSPTIVHGNLTHHTIDVLNDDLPDVTDFNSLVYCPGSINLKPISSLKLENFREDFEINVLGAVKVIKHYLRDLKKAENPSITLFSTVAVKQGMPFHSSVAAAKAAVEGITKSLAAELAPTIRVNCIAPTITQTSLAANLLRNEAAIERMEQRHPLKKILQADEVAGLASYLMSEQARGITGQIFGIDGGLSTLKI